MGGIGHGLSATGDDDIGVAGDDGLGTQDDGLESGGADLVDCSADGAIRETGTECALPSGILAVAVRELRRLVTFMIVPQTGKHDQGGEGRNCILCGQDIAEENLFNLFWLDFRSSLDGGCNRKKKFISFKSSNFLYAVSVK